MNLIAIRHGETTMNKEERLQGCKGPDMPLDEEGRASIKKLRDGFLIMPTAIYSSPLKRTLETAEIINERYGLDIIVRPEIRERDFGSLSGKLKSEVDPKIMEADLENRYDYRKYGGESVEEVKKRLNDFLFRLPLRSKDDMLVITHRGIIRLLYDLYPQQSTPEEIFPGSKHVFRIDAMPGENVEPIMNI